MESDQPVSEMSMSDAVCIVDDDEAVLGFLVMVVSQVCRNVRGFLEPEKMLAEQIEEPVCLIVDWHLKNADGLEVLSRCQERWPHTPMILISGHATVPVAVTAMRQGVLGVLEKPVRAEDLLREVTAAIAQGKMRKKSAAESEAARRLIESLSDGERKVLELVVQGTANKRIASQLDLSMRTIEKYRAALFDKLGVDSAAAATQIWVRSKS